MHKASEALAAGASFVLLGPKATMLKATVPVVAVCAVRTGSGKSQTTRAIAQTLRDAGKRVVAVRHPMPYGDLVAQRVQRFATLEDLDRYDTTIEEREEYEPHIAAGTIIYAGVDYGDILEQAQAECDVLLWDGGNNDLPFYEPDVHVVVADPLRAGHETTLPPGRGEPADGRRDRHQQDGLGAIPSRWTRCSDTIARREPRRDGRPARTAGSSVEDPDAIAGKRVLVVEDGPTLTHGEMKFGAGVVAARAHGAAEIVDPRPWAVGTIEETFRKYDVGPVLPAMGYSDGQLGEMREDHRRGRRRRRRDRDADRPAPRDRDPQARGARPLRPRGPAGLAEPRSTCSGPSWLRPDAVERVVVALGGNALLRRGQEDTFENLYRSARSAAEQVADIARRGGRSSSPTGTGRRSAGSSCSRRPPAGGCIRCRSTCAGRESQGQIGYLLQVTIGDVFFERGMERPVATVLTLTRVRPDDPAFADPTKPIGPFYEEDEAKALAASRGGSMRADSHGGWRRVVPSPDPYSIVEAPVIRSLVARRRDRDRVRRRRRPGRSRTGRGWSASRASSTRTSPRRSSPETSRRRRC